MNDSDQTGALTLEMADHPTRTEFNTLSAKVDAAATAAAEAAEAAAQAASAAAQAASAAAEFNKMTGTDLEFNVGSDAEIRGKKNDFLMVDSQSLDATRSVKFIGASAYSNTWHGGKAGRIDLDASTKGNSVRGVQAGTISDLSTGANRNRVEDCTDTSGNWTDTDATSAPVVTAGSGSITAYTSFLVGRRVGNRYRFTVTVVLDGNGTGATEVIVQMPHTSLYSVAFNGAQTTGSRLALGGLIFASSSSLRIRTGVGAYPGVTGTAVTMSGEYLIA